MSFGAVVCVFVCVCYQSAKWCMKVKYVDAEGKVWRRKRG